MKRVLVLLISLFVLFSLAALNFTSCGEAEESENKLENITKTSAEEGDIFWERAQFKDDIGDYDFGGKELRVVSHDASDFWVDEDDINKGDLIKDAYAERTRAVEERFNFKLVLTYTARYDYVRDYVIKTVTSGSDEFDLFCSQLWSAGNIVTKNVFINWYDVPNVDFEKPWWSEFNRTQLTYDGKCILAISDFSFRTVMSAQCVYFNKALAEAYDLGNLYEVVNDGKWTYEYFYDIIKDVYIDEDGDGEKSRGDFYGVAQPGNEGVSAFLAGFDNPVAIINSEGEPEDVLKTDKIYDIVDTMINHCHNTKGVYFIPVETNGRYKDYSESPIHLFYEGKAIFTVATLGNVTDAIMRNFKDDYGILPMPKWNEYQDRYYTNVAYQDMSYTNIGPHISVLAVPKTCKDIEFVGACVEALTAETWKTVSPTFYEIALKTRYLRDDESKITLDYILDGRSFTFGGVYGGSGFGFNSMKLIERQEGKFESWYQSQRFNIKDQLKALKRTFNKLG